MDNLQTLTVVLPQDMVDYIREGAEEIGITPSEYLAWIVRDDARREHIILDAFCCEPQSDGCGY